MIAVVYYSGTGNTLAMAQAVAQGCDGQLFTSAQFNESMVDEYDAIAFGCPSMGCEQLEESEFEPMFLALESKLNGKKIALFGSYGWGVGEWMDEWLKRCESLNANVVAEPVIVSGYPDDDTLQACNDLGKCLL